MSLAQRTLLSSPEFMQRLAVTLAALAVYRLGAYVPLAGINPTRLASLYRDSPLLKSLGSADERFSVVGLGVTPIVSVLLLLECARLLSPRCSWPSPCPSQTCCAGSRVERRQCRERRVRAINRLNVHAYLAIELHRNRIGSLNLQGHGCGGAHLER
jgi:hypothetical protein